MTGGKTWPWIAGLAVLGAGLVLATTLNGYYVFVLAQVALLALVGIGLNVLIGLSGQVSFGHVGFYAIGAYAVAILTGAAGWSFWAAWPVALLVAAAAGALLALPALRVKGPYLAMITIAFGFIVEHGAAEWRGLTGGQNGLMGYGGPSLGGLASGERAVAMLALIAAALAFVGYCLLARGRWGAGLRAVRDSETAAEAIGLKPLPIKVVAFAVSAGLAGLAGGLFAPLAGMVTPGSFAFVQSILFVLVVVLGGAGSAIGPLIGALIVGLLPEVLSGMEEYRLLFFGALLLVVLWVAPDGVAGLLQRLSQHLWQRRETPLMAGGVSLPLVSRVRQGLSAEGLGRMFGGVRAVHELSFVAQPGAVTALIGPNGAGKTTALNLLSGFYTPSSGGFALGDKALAGQPAHAVARAGLARSYQTSQLFGSLSVLDNVALACLRGRLGGLFGAAGLRSAAVQARSLALLGACGYVGDANLPAADLPHVDRRVVEIARALATDPDMLLLDEPAAGLSAEDKQRLAVLLRRIADEAGVGVLLVEHDMGLVMGVSDHIVVLDAGQRLAMGTPAEIQADPLVRRAYLGDDMDEDSRLEAPVAAHQRQLGAELLHVGALHTGYGAAPVLKGIELQLREGELLAVLGANGAGKSTLMRALAGLQRPVQGGIHLAGEDLTDLGAEAIARRGLVLVPEGRQVFPELSVRDNLRLGGFLHPEGLEARAEAMLERFPRLRERLHQRAGLLSGGEQQMLAVARGLMAKPRVLLLDEPSLGLAPKVIADLFAVLARLREEGLTIVLVDQMAALALSLADRACVIEDGQVVLAGTAAEVAADPALRKAYLGA
ncbi:branched-chain amino acid ABC transporter ATP-binding protein/permease [Paucibacter sp. M5-1]|uniref:branched-chain amino acid ABC transporter ATP-binding protein/permease n=1 Tax=Paucibacter sp. M5-1 TaxID=3015998 RepID=UPI0022B8F456|nr:ATP-binding cassette domain-containing protein [Paucibacter sp. M5-1]MCZ7879950.1 ATP-binding cassette domain-containing protein [Paucibacter sp. M5-1]